MTLALLYVLSLQIKLLLDQIKLSCQLCSRFLSNVGLASLYFKKLLSLTDLVFVFSAVVLDCFKLVLDELFLSAEDVQFLLETLDFDLV